MHRLVNPMRHYGWGSVTAIPAFVGAEPDGRPVAEMWMSAHPSAPSRLGNASGATLDAAIAAHPKDMLGAEVAERYGARLPFLLKLLAADRPLSLQVHPTAEQAAAGFDREEAAGIPLSAPTRNYKDSRHKPEILFALTPFELLCGFRPPRDVLARLAAVAARRSALLDRFRAALEHPDEGLALKRAFDVVVTADDDTRHEATAELAKAAAEDATLIALARANPAIPE